MNFQSAPASNPGGGISVMKDQQLDDLLKAAKGPPALPSVFTREVWRDIEHRSTYGTAAWMDTLLQFLALPAPRLAVWALALGLGLYAGVRHPKTADPIAVYAYSINPLAPAIAP